MEKGCAPMQERHGSSRDGLEMDIDRKTETATPLEKKVGTYIVIWVGIVLLTGLSFAASRMSTQGGAVIASLFIAGVQSGLALTYFMHLGTEKEPIFKVLIPLVLAVLLVFITLTFSDVAFRR
jgi:caa(3)-type oxidase subunit IV